MTGVQLAAVVGLSVGAGSVVGWWARGWRADRVPRGQRQLVRHFYLYLDDRIGATKTENLRRATYRFRVIHMRHWWLWLILPLWIVPKGSKKLRRAVADYFWPVPQLGTGTAALPGVKRMARYVQLELRGDTTFRRPYQLWNVQAVVVRPTSEVDVHTGGFEPVLARWVAWAMRLTDPGQVEVEAHPELGYWRLARKLPAPEFTPTVPHGVGADA